MTPIPSITYEGTFDVRDGELLAAISSNENEIYNGYVNLTEQLKQATAKFNLPLTNNLAFFTALCSDDHQKHIDELLPLIGTMLFSFPFLHSILSDSEPYCDTESILQYLRLSNYLSGFSAKYAEAIRVQNEYTKYVTTTMNSEYALSTKYTLSPLSPDLYEKLNDLYGKYVDDQLIPESNLELVYSYVNQSSKSRAIIPFLIYQLFVKFAKPLQKDGFAFEKINLYTKKEYKISDNNGKNFKTYAKCMVLFIELLKVFESVCDRALSIYFFEQSSNLIEWAFRYHDASYNFDSSIYSLVASSNFSLFSDSPTIPDVPESTGNSKSDRCQDERVKANIQKYVASEVDEVRSYIEAYRSGRQKEVAYLYTLALKTCRSFEQPAEFHCYEKCGEELMRSMVDEIARLKLRRCLGDHVNCDLCLFI